MVGERPRRDRWTSWQKQAMIAVCTRFTSSRKNPCRTRPMAMTARPHGKPRKRVYRYKRPGKNLASFSLHSHQPRPAQAGRGFFLVRTDLRRAHGTRASGHGRRVAWNPELICCVLCAVCFARHAGAGTTRRASLFCSCPPPAFGAAPPLPHKRDSPASPCRAWPARRQHSRGKMSAILFGVLASSGHRGPTMPRGRRAHAPSDLTRISRRGAGDPYRDRRE